jgi:hypothetical protein
MENQRAMVVYPTGCKISGMRTGIARYLLSDFLSTTAFCAA